MDPLRILTGDCGFFTRQEALSAGHSDRSIAQMVRGGAWLRFRRGYYAFPDEWAALDDVGRHRVRCNAVLRSLGDVVALSHQSGVVRHDIDVWGLDLSRVHVTRLDGGPGRIEGDVVHHEGLAVDDDVVLVDGQQVLRAQRCVIEAGSRARNDVALALFDSGLRAGRYDQAALTAQFSLMEHWPYVRHLHIPVRMADPLSGSVGESRGMWMFFQLGIPAPVKQYQVHDHEGLLVAVTDWYWEQFKMLGEFDGELKYGRLLKPGQTAGDVVFEEKKREDLVRELTRCGMFRLIWADYENPRRILARFNRVTGRAG